MRKVCTKMVPKDFTKEQKQRRVKICQDILGRQVDILVWAIKGDETWVYQHDPETKQQTAQWKTANSPGPKKSVGPNQESKLTCLILLILEGFFIMNLYQLDR